MSRRDFLKQSGALGALGFLGGVGRTGSLLAASAQVANAANAANATNDYRALVCVFLYGGNDGNNLLVPTDAAGYAAYSAVRDSASGINLAQSSLLPLVGPAGDQPYTAFGLHPALSELQPLYAQQHLALLCNVGPLLQATSKEDYLAGRFLPASLFSHSDQQNAWQSAQAGGASRSGWGGRVADRLQGLNGDATAFPVSTSVAGNVLFAAGDRSTGLVLPASGGFSLRGADSSKVSQARLLALKTLVGAEDDNVYVVAANRIASQALQLSERVDPVLTGSSPTIESLFVTQNNSLAQELLQVAKLIEARQTLGVKRQIFFVSLGGFDTHTGQANTQQNLFAQLSSALNSFYEATVKLGVAEQVTSFTLSDFGRTFKPASGGGSDHAWGNHHLILGGAVRGGALYGRYPTLQLSGPDDVSEEGRWLPTTAVDQYAATLARWMGVAEADLAAVAPGIGGYALRNLGFLG
ncbi:MAG: DUF1501 domain-containing protein [Betaproteobacteria bacterium]|nr:DUF1501 domain-containing protein [Betaproteobacteria bacterium]